MSWPVKTVTIDSYSWEAQIVSLSLEEVDLLQGAVNSKSADEIASVLLRVVTSWNFTDRGDNVLPLSAAGFKKAPLDALRVLIGKIFESLNDDPLVETNT